MRRRTVLLVTVGAVVVGGAVAGWKQEDIRRAVRHSPSYARISQLPVLDGVLPRSVLNRRLVTGIALGGTAQRPVLYVSSSDPRLPGPGQNPRSADTNSGILSRLTLDRGGWRHQQLVRGLPRSHHEHAPNGLALDEQAAVLYLAAGSMTDSGWPSLHFQYLPEYALSAGLLRIDLRGLVPPPHDLPTLDDPTRAGDPDSGDPFGGNGGLNQARLPTAGPVRLHTAGLRNPYDVVRTRAGRLYVTDNGPSPADPATPDTCSNEPHEGGPIRVDSLRDITAPGTYGGHPNPTRGGAVTHPDQIGTPVAGPDRRQCLPVPVSKVEGVVTTFETSTNGLTEYTSSALGGALTGALLTVSLDGSLILVDPKRRGRAAQVRLSDAVAVVPLDLTAAGDDGPFPGSIWVADWGAGRIVVLAPGPTGSCAPISERCFRRSTLRGARLDKPTSIAWGPDGRLYVSEQNGLIRAFSVDRDAGGELTVTDDETITAVRDIPNHDDDGRPAARLPLVD
jgi:hypothetical protein